MKTSSILTNGKVIAGIVGGVVLILAIWFGSSLGTNESTAPAHPLPSPAISPDHSGIPMPAPAVNPAPEKTPVAAVSADVLIARLRDFTGQFKSLRAAHKGLVTLEFREAAEKLYAAMIQPLRTAAPEVRAAAISQYLKSGEDTSTGMNFVVGQEGHLTEAPSIRTALLDLLPEADPAQSVAFAKEVLSKSASPDEWALAMRNLGLQNADGSQTGELRQAFKKMIDNQEWLQEGSQGLMKALDVAVALGGPQDFEALASLVHLENSFGLQVENAVSQSAIQALQQMAFNNPGQTIAQLDASPDLLSWAPKERGSLMACANVSDASQRAAVEKYMQRSDLAPEEIAAFMSTFPNVRPSSSFSLVPTPSPDYQKQLAGQSAALAMLKQWQQDPRFQARSAELQGIIERLANLH